MKIYFRLVAVLISAALNSQNISSEGGLVLDNDLFISLTSDQYYTSGIEVFYRFSSKATNPEINKIIKDFRIGQYIYNPQTVEADNYYLNDRPFAGYLFLQAGTEMYFHSESVLKINGQFGILGPSAFGEEVQKFIHNTVGYKKVGGWQYQITDAYALQVEGYYSKKIFSKKSGIFADCHAQANVTAGTIWTGASAGLVARIGLKELFPVFDSNLHNASKNTTHIGKEITEFYLYISPNLNYQLYDATIQGSLFNHKSPVKFDITPFRFNAEAGLKYRKNNWNLYYSVSFKGKELYNNVITSFYYGSIGISHLFD